MSKYLIFACLFLSSIASANEACLKLFDNRAELFLKHFTLKMTKSFVEEHKETSPDRIRRTIKCDDNCVRSRFSRYRRSRHLGPPNSIFLHRPIFDKERRLMREAYVRTKDGGSRFVEVGMWVALDSDGNTIEFSNFVISSHWISIDGDIIGMSYENIVQKLNQTGNLNRVSVLYFVHRHPRLWNSPDIPMSGQQDTPHKFSDADRDLMVEVRKMMDRHPILRHIQLESYIMYQSDWWDKELEGSQVIEENPFEKIGYIVELDRG